MASVRIKTGPIVLGLCLVFTQSAAPYIYPLSEESVREAYFLGRTTDLEKLAKFLGQYVYHFPRGPLFTLESLGIGGCHESEAHYRLFSFGVRVATGGGRGGAAADFTGDSIPGSGNNDPAQHARAGSDHSALGCGCYAAGQSALLRGPDAGRGRQRGDQLCLRLADSEWSRPGQFFLRVIALSRCGGLDQHERAAQSAGTHSPERCGLRAVAWGNRACGAARASRAAGCRPGR